MDGALVGTPSGVSKFDFSDNFGCLPFTWANRWVDGLGKWYVKFMTGKIRPRIAFTICTNQFHTPRNDREGLKLVLKMALKKWNTNFRLEYSVREKRTTFSDVPLLPEIFHLERHKKSCAIHVSTGFSGNLFVNGKQTRKLNPSDHRTLLSKPLIFFFPSSSSLLDVSYLTIYNVNIL